MYQVQGVNQKITPLQHTAEYYRRNPLVIEYQGIRLSRIFEARRIFSHRGVLKVGYDLVSVLESLHSKSLVHGDIGPANVVIGAKGNGWLYLLDYGLASFYRDPESLHHYPQVPLFDRGGTSCFASLDRHRALSLSRRDDMQSLGYMLAWLSCYGSLPWQDVRARTTQEMFHVTYQMKRVASSNPNFFLLWPLPPGLREFFRLAFSLSFSDKPDYDAMRRALQLR
ncbi:hypothetical protein NUU61_001610 [Penicillium alfredii]|uniref:Protein kinase domain-containing protein n=1 Tax=Penicillium alfredii TaxID=1506179 RepID=A0A9W9KLY0_9EURO|nr:uncharacterized protein NUU61_001610 [Penicillium alfredii]KAJ5110353.1 hypothetical protein NUU61_001610 [Penicillium alfredii]